MNSRALEKIFWQGCLNCILRVQGITEEKYSREKFFVCFFLDFQGEFFVGFVKNAFHESIVTFLDLKKTPKHVHSELADSGEKNQPTEE